MRVADRSGRGTAVVALAALLGALAACSSGSADDAAPAATVTDVGASTTMSTTVAATVAASTAASTTTSTIAPTAPTTASASRTTAPSSTSSTALAPQDDVEEFVLGASVEGRPITAFRRGDPDGTTVLVIAVIHGDEDAGAAIADELRVQPVPEGIDLWVVPTANPDGQAAQIRHNANGVDLNRNFPEGWAPIAVPGDWQYAGSGAASEPETQALVALGELIRPDLTLWYHQDLFRINPASGRGGRVRQRYAELTGLPIVPITGGTYTGTASQWSRAVAADGGIGFTVELGPELTPGDAARHAAAVLTVASEL